MKTLLNNFTWTCQNHKLSLLVTTNNNHVIMKKIYFILFLLLSLATYSQDNAKHYTIIVSLDGFRWDYPQIYGTPNLDKMASIGVKAEKMTPSYPASTFPNHYTLATGLTPDHHGIVNNSFWIKEKDIRYAMGDSITQYNPQFYGGEPIWITAQKQGVKVGVLYWVGSDIAIKNTYPTYYKKYGKAPFLTLAQRVDSAIAWFQKPENERPQLIMLYMEEPDHTGHGFGPISKETKNAVHYVDSLVGVLINKIEKLPIASQVNMIVTSDHGMAQISNKHWIKIQDHLKPSWYIHIEGSNPTSIFCKSKYKDSILNALNKVSHIKAYKKEEIPQYLHYGTNERIGDIVVCPDCGWQFADIPKNGNGAHGYDPTHPNMQVIFRAFGPDFKEKYISKGFVNTDIYSLLAHLLNIKPAKTDGSLSGVKDLLKQH